MAQPSSNSRQELEYLIRAGYGLIATVSSEEARVEREVLVDLSLHGISFRGYGVRRQDSSERDQRRDGRPHEA